MKRVSTSVIKEAHNLRTSTPGHTTPPPRNRTPTSGMQENLDSPMKTSNSMSPQRWLKAPIEPHSRVMHEILTSPALYRKLKKDELSKS